MIAARILERDDWGAADPFDSLDLPAFPVETLPGWCRTWATEAARVFQVPVDLPASVALGVMSFAACRVARVKPRPDWNEPLNLYTVVALPPGEKKSPIFKLATAAIHARQHELNEELAPKIQMRTHEREIIAGEISHLKKMASVGKKHQGTDPRQRIAELAHKLSELEELHIPQLMTDDITAEALGIVLSQSDERTSLFSSEGDPFEVMAGRYSEKGGNFGLFLKAHSGDSHIVNRVRREPFILEHPLISIGLTCQPCVIEGLATKDGFRGRGLLARFLYSLPTSRLGDRDVDPEPMAEHAQEDLEEALLTVLRREGSSTIALSQGARDALVAFSARIEPELREDGALRPIADWANKLAGAVVRIAGILHLFDFGASGEITTAQFVRAQAIGEYFLAHAKAAFTSMGTDATTQLAKKIWTWAQSHGRDEFTAREAQRARGGTGTAEETAAALAQLVERRLVRPAPKPRGLKGGRPAESYQVRPT